MSVPTPYLIKNPSKYVIDDWRWERVDVREWSRRFTWRQDPWFGLVDTVKPPGRTWKEEEGDCEDYALVIASALVSQDVEGVGIAFMADVIPPSGHTVAYDSEHVYSNGRIHTTSIQEFVSDYDYHVLRPL